MDTDNGTAGETASSETEYVSIDEASDADLSSYLETAKKDRQEFGDDPEEDEDDFEESAGESKPKLEEQSEETSEAQAPPEKLNSKEKDAEIAKLQADKEEIKKKALDERKQRETYIQRLKYQLGEERKAKGDLEKSLTERYREQLDIDPAEAIETRLELGEVKKQLSEIDNYEARVDSIHENQTIFEANVDPSEVSIDEIVASFEREGLPKEVVDNIRARPFETMRAETLIQAQHKVKAQRLLFQTVEFAKNVILERDELQAKLNSKPRSVENSLKRISQAAKSMPQMTGARGGGSSSMPLEDIDVDNMSDQELKELSKKLRGR